LLNELNIVVFIGNWNSIQLLHHFDSVHPNTWINCGIQFSRSRYWHWYTFESRRGD